MYCSVLPAFREDTDWVLADIGGTYARLACWSAPAGRSEQRRFENADFGGLHEVLAAHGKTLTRPVRRALLALALPVTGDRLTFTNRDWSFDAPQLAARLGLETLVIVNDFVAAAAGAVAPERTAVSVQQGEPRGAMRAVLGPGTGLGVAGVLDGGVTERARVIESEAGHMSFAATDDESLRVLHAAQTAWGRVSWERLLCGSGLAWVDATLRGSRAIDPPARVAQRAHAGDAAAMAAARWFSHALGSFAGDVCLALRATGGVYLAGGVLAGLGPAFERAAFRDGFADKGRFRALLEDVPCWRIDAGDLALHGLADIARGRIGAPGVLVEAMRA